MSRKKTNASMRSRRLALVAAQVMRESRMLHMSLCMGSVLLSLVCSGCYIFSGENLKYSEGSGHHRKGEYEKAIDAYTEAIELNPSYLVAYTGRAAANFELGRYQEAIDDMTKAFELTDGGEWTFANGHDCSGRWSYLRGSAYFELGQYEEALTDFSRAVDRGEEYLDSATLASNPGIDAKPNHEKALGKYREAKDRAARCCGNY